MVTTTALILASASPRRRQLLQELGIIFDVDPSDVPEVPFAGEAPAAFAQRVARDKALEGARRHPRCFVLGADTVVRVDAAIFGKPMDREDGRRMLRVLSGRTHEVITAVALVTPGGHVEELSVATAVEFRALSSEDIETYLDSGEPFDKAGGYAVQGLAKSFVVAMRGSLTNVIGLPVEATIALLQRHGVLPSASGGGSTPR